TRGSTKWRSAPAMAAMLAVRRPTGSANLQIALGWHILTTHGKEIVWHNGGTAGYRTFIGFDRAARTGVVVLSNAGTAAGPDDIGRHLLDPESPLLTLTAPAQHAEIKVDPTLYDHYVRRYQPAPSILMAVTREGDHLCAQVSGQAEFGIFPGAGKEWF